MSLINAALLALAGPASIERLKPIIAQASATTHLPSSWIGSVIAVESDGRLSGLHGPLRSPVGAMGLMQIMPRTWTQLTANAHRTLDPDRPPDNIAIGSTYLLQLYRQFGFPGAFAAYQAGPGGYQQMLAGGKALPTVTRRYVDQILARLGSGVSERARRGAGNHVVASLFVTTKLDDRSAPKPLSDGERCEDPGRIFICLENETSSAEASHSAPISSP